MSEKSNDWKDEAYKAYVAKLRAHEAEESDRRRQEGKVTIWWDRAPNDAETFTAQHQIDLHEFIDALRKQGIELEAPFLAVDAADAVSGYTGQVIISLVQAVGPVLTGVLVAWLKRPGRKVRVEFHPSGKTKTVEAQSTEQVLSIVKALDEEARKDASKRKDK